MSNNSRRPFTCYFCNQLIKNETEMGHTTLCSKVLIPCPYKCGSYVQRADLAKHKTECNNNVRKSINFDLNTPKSIPQQHSNSINTNSLGRKHTKQIQPLPNRNGIPPPSRPKIQEDVVALYRRLSELEVMMSSLSNLNNRNNISTNSSPVNATTSRDVDDVKTTLKQHSLSIQKANYFNGFISEWKKKMDAQVTTLKNSLTSIDTLKKESGKQWSYIQEKLQYLQNLQLDLSLLKETVFKENAHFRKTEVDLTRNLEEIRSTFNQQNMSFENMWREQTAATQNAFNDIQSVKQSIDEQRAKFSGFVFDFRSVSQISSEAAEKIEILEREFNIIRQDVNQMKVNMEILEDLSCSDSLSYKRLIWRITEVGSKLKRAKENDIVMKSPIFYTHRYGYKIRVLLYINGLNKWKDRYALACIHVLKGEYDPLLTWPCTIEGNITLRDLVDKSQAKNFSKYIKTKRASGDEDEDEPQESSSTYIFIPHTVLFKDNFIKDDTIFFDINISDNINIKYETSL